MTSNAQISPAAQTVDRLPGRLVDSRDNDGNIIHVWVPDLPKPKKQRKKPDPIKTSNNAAAQKIGQIIERMENLMAERAEIGEQMAEVMGEAKALGFDTKAIREVLKRRAADPSSLKEREEMVDLYLHHIGMAEE